MQWTNSNENTSSTNSIWESLNFIRYVIIINNSGTTRYLSILNKDDKFTLEHGKQVVQGKDVGGVGSETIDGKIRDEDVPVEKV